MYRGMGVKERYIKVMEYFFVYILKCADGSYYVGHTDNIEKRIIEHKSGTHKGFTSRRLPVKLVFQQEFESRDAAFVAERKIKEWSRKKKEALIKRDFDLLSEFSKKKF